MSIWSINIYWIVLNEHGAVVSSDSKPRGFDHKEDAYMWLNLEIEQGRLDRGVDYKIDERVKPYLD